MKKGIDKWLRQQHAKRARKIRKYAKKIVDTLQGEIATQEEESRYFELRAALNYFIARQDELSLHERWSEEEKAWKFENFWD